MSSSTGFPRVMRRILLCLSREMPNLSRKGSPIESSTSVVARFIPEGYQELVCVPCVVSRDHRSIAHPACLGGCSFEALNNVLGGKVQKGSYLCTDANSIYCKFAKENELNLVQIKGGKETKGQFHIQHLNSYHSMLKKFMEKFNGVATKYLDGYLAWHNFLNYANEGIEDKARILKEWLVKCGKNFTRDSIFAMPSLSFACR